MHVQPSFDPHPLDWVAYLRQALVFDPVPTFLTLLLVSSHFYACCVSKEQATPNANSNQWQFSSTSTSTAGGRTSSPSASASTSSHSSSSSSSSGGGSTGESKGPETSVLGNVFAGAAYLVRQVTPTKHLALELLQWLRKGLNPNQTQQQGFINIRTPLNDLGSKTNHEQQQHARGSGSSSNPSSAASHKKGETVTDRILSAAMTDPISMMYDAWWYLSSDATAEGEDGTLDDSEDEYHVLLHHPSPLEYEEQQKSCRRGPLSSSPPPLAVHADLLKIPVWKDVCMLHLLGMASLSLMLLPSILNPSMLACNAMPRVQASAWPVLNSSLLMLGLSWTCCCAMQFVLGLHRLALCVAMHSVARLMMAYAGAASACPMPPIFMPTAVASGIALFVGVMLLCVCHMLHTSSAAFGTGEDAVFDTEDFYMNHAWACGVVLLVMRHTVFRFCAWLHCCVHARCVREAMMLCGG